MVAPRVHFYGVVDSTNDIALRMARRGQPEGTVVLALGQTAGRGRRGRSWWDEPGKSVLMSVVLRPEGPAECVPQLSFVVSLSAAEMLACDYSLNAAVKWPNDVMAGGRKIAGILVETTRAPGGVAAIVGIGLNVSQAKFPREIEGAATSIAIECGAVCGVEEASDRLLARLFANYDAYLARGFEEILERWRKYMWGLGRQAALVTEERSLRGVISGVEPTGALLVTDHLGEVHAVRSAETINVETNCSL